MRFEVQGTPMPVAICYLEAGESVKTEKGAMSWMSPNLRMETEGGGIGKMFSKAFPASPCSITSTPQRAAPE